MKKFFENVLSAHLPNDAGGTVDFFGCDKAPDLEVLSANIRALSKKNVSNDCRNLNNSGITLFR